MRWVGMPLRVAIALPLSAVLLIAECIDNTHDKGWHDLWITWVWRFDA